MSLNIIWLIQHIWSRFFIKITSIYPIIWLILGIFLVVSGVLIGWILFPYVLKTTIANKINLSPGKESRKSWVHMPVFDFRVYLFNITNPSAVMQGEKPIVEEIGPYCYKQEKVKEQLEDNEMADSITYRSRTTWYESQSDPHCRSPHLTGDEPIVIPNVPLLSILMVAEKDYPAPFLALVNLALPRLFGRLDDIFLRTTAKQLIFGGIIIDCSSPSIMTMAVCNAIKQHDRGLKKLAEGLYSFSFFGHKNASLEEFQHTVRRGTNISEDVGKIIYVDNKPQLNFWRGNCNQLHGTDGSIFPPFRKKENGITSYSSDICRVISGVYEGEYDYQDIKGYSYTLALGDAENNPEDRCYCPADNRCYKKGVLDAYKCQGAPLAYSLPHFYQSSTDYLEGVKGLHPERSKHEIHVVLEPMSGVPLVVRKRIQLNIDLRAISYSPVTEGLAHTMTPLFWLEELLDLKGDELKLLQASLFQPIFTVNVFKWICIIIGSSLFLIFIIMKVRIRRRNQIHKKGRMGISAGNIYNIKGLKYLEHEGSNYSQKSLQGLSVTNLTMNPSNRMTLPFVKE